VDRGGRHRRRLTSSQHGLLGAVSRSGQSLQENRGKHIPDVAKTVEQLGDLDALEEQLSRVRDIVNDALKAVEQLDDLYELQRNLSSISNLAETTNEIGLGDLDDLQRKLSSIVDLATEAENAKE
jgi:ABC-type transporter Mla subunit MlaD